MSMRRRGFALVALLGCVACGALGQTSPAFEVATVKPADPDNPDSSLMMSKGHFEVRGQTVFAIIKFAYGLNMGADDQISGGPKWLATTKFDIDAKEDEEFVASSAKLGREGTTEQIKLMVQALLADRFKLRVHHETKTLPVFALITAKGGPKMALDAPPDPEHSNPRGSGIRGHGAGSLEGLSVQMAMFTNVIARQPEVGGKMVIDRTELPGKYNFTLKWTPETAGGAATTVDPAAPGFFTALEEQLGLKLESTRAPIDTIVVDSAEMPSAN